MGNTAKRQTDITRSMLLGFIGVALIMVLTAGVSLWRLQGELAHANRFHENGFHVLLAADSLANGAARELFAYLASGSQDELADFRARSDAAGAELARYAAIAHLDEQEREQSLRTFTGVQNAWTGFRNQAELLLSEYAASGAVPDPRFDQLAVQADGMFKLFEALKAEEEAFLDRGQRQVEALVRQSGWQMLVLVVIGLTALLLIGAWLARQIGRYLDRIEERELSLELHAAALESSHVGFCYTDAGDDHTIVFANQALCELSGYEEHELVGRNCRLFQGEETDPESVAAMREAIAQGRAMDTVVRNYRKDGEAFWNDLHLSPVRDASGKVTHYVGAMTDVSEQIELTRQFARAQKMEAVGQLAGGVAHDFNNYLTVILGNAEILRHDVDEEPLRAHAQQIIEAGERSASLTRQLLAFSKRQVLVAQTLDLNRVILDLDPLLRRTLGERVSLETMTAGGLGQVSADRSQIEQVLLNLVVNARDAMPDGGSITVETGNVYLDAEYADRVNGVEEGRYVMIAVSDTGGGIPPNILEHIFEPFFTTKESGGGLGLSTVQGIVEQSGGIVRVYSEPGSGTTFKVYLPRVKAPQESPTPPSMEAAEPLSGTVLVVEDEAMVRQITTQMLRNLGLEVLEADSGSAGLGLLKLHGPRIDLLLTDVMLPGINGRELAEEASRLIPGLAILFMSGYTENGIVHHGRLDEGVYLLEKPFSIEQLRRKVVQVRNAARQDRDSG